MKMAMLITKHSSLKIKKGERNMKILERVISAVAIIVLFLGAAGIQDIDGKIQMPCVIMAIVGGVVLAIISNLAKEED